MRIEHLRLRGFRNISKLDLELGGSFHVFVGQNAQGKTNLLEAIYLLATLKSFRGPMNRELIQWGADRAKLYARMSARSRSREHSLEIHPRGRRLRVDGKTPRPLTDYFHGIRAVSFTPEDLQMIRGAPQGRRDFLDRLSFDLEPGHLERIRSLYRCLKQKGALLRRRPAARETEIQAFEPLLRRVAAEVLVARLETVRKLQPIFSSVLGSIAAQEQSSSQLRYCTSLGATQGLSEALGRGEHSVALEEAETLVAGALERVREAERRRGMCLAGPQRDDLDVLLAGKSLRTFGSQGQVRSAALALKMAHRSLVTELRGRTPLFLLDDVGSELDSQRAERLMAWLEHAPGQVFLTATDAVKVPLSPAKYRSWTVSTGSFREERC